MLYLKLTTKILIGLILGLIAGVALNTIAVNVYPFFETYLLTPVGTIFINLIRMMVVPLVLLSIISGAASIGDPKKLGRVGGKTIVFYFFTTAIAISLGLLLANIFKPGNGVNIPANLSNYTPSSAPPIVDTFLNMIPTNPIAAMVNGEMLQIIVFAMFVGVTMGFMGDRAKSVLKLVDDLNQVMIEIVHLIMKSAPYGVFALIASAVAAQGVEVILPMAKYMLLFISSLLLHAVITYGSIVKFFSKMNPMHFFKGVSPAAAVAFSTSSSAATLPVTMEVVEENLGVKREIGSFVLPLGATINMDGTAMMQGIAAVFISQVYGLELSLAQQVTIVLTATLASIGTAGVPGVGMIMLTMVLESVGLPLEGIAIVLGVDRLLDMSRTAVNIVGDAAISVVVAATENAVDYQVVQDYIANLKS